MLIILSFDLPPTERAAPLPVRNAKTSNQNARPNKKRKINKSNGIVGGYGADDTPKEFARLMAFKTTGKRRKGLDDGRPSKPPSNSKPHSQKEIMATDTEPKETDTVDSEAQDVNASLKIQPGERLSDFAARVNQALPLAGVKRTGKKVDGMTEHRLTRHDKKLRKLQEGWRKEEARIREKEEEARELAEEEQDEIEAMWEDKTADLPSKSTAKTRKKAKKGKKKLVIGEVDDGQDEWEALRKKRQDKRGLHDVVQAPPQIDRVPREIFKVKNGAKVNVGNIPNAAGSLRKREELGEERQSIIDTYRKMMEAKRGG